MPKPRTPTPLKLLRGTAQPCRLNPDEPIVTEAQGAPPAHLNAAQRRCWREIATIAPKGVLMKPDRIAVERAAVLLAESRADPEGFIAAKETRLNSYLSRFAMTPSDRSRVKVPQAAESSPWDEL